MCDAEAEAWLGPLHEAELGNVFGEAEADADTDVERALKVGHILRGRYMLYSPCVEATHERGYCLGQFNNQARGRCRRRRRHSTAS